jgi:pimeloyl-ACP methyl ester carboxylesterase
MQKVVSLLIAAAVVYLGLCGVVLLVQRSQIYFPQPEADHPRTQVVWLDSEGARLKIWSILRPGSAALIYFGGNAEDVAGNIELFSAAFPDRSLYLVNYRGYGGSSGRPSEKALFADALAIYDHALTRHAHVAIMGRSLGSGVAVYVASQRPVERLVLVTAYDSLVKVAQRYYPYLPVNLLLRDRYDSVSRASQVKAPVLLVIAEEDEIIPRARSQALAAAFRPGQARTTMIRSAMHNSLDLAPEYLRTVQAFLDERRPRPGSVVDGESASGSAF